ncbi:MAG: AAA family ATPase [Anaerolineaceae bacterium]|nr:AAA family ATPase [Anaerolineaceae bacterium]
MAEQRPINGDMQALLDVLPSHIREAVFAEDNFDNLLEIVLDLGRIPFARFVSGEVKLSDQEITTEDIRTVVENIGDFDADNRAGMERTLHRISAIRSRRGHIVGLTCRVGRAVYGTLNIIQDLVESGQSLLILGKPGIGKTTMLREAARVLAETKRVIIVDTSNEIGGDGDVPHPAVGRARRMQVSKPSLQHEVMIEAVENHNPEVIVIDEIGRELEAVAARTIAERGVQLIGTAHGRTLENLLLNPTLSDLIGGVESVTLSDEEARRRGTQKTVLERRSPPTFDVLVEIQERNLLAVHPDVATSVDALVRGLPPLPEIRFRDEDGKVQVRKPTPPQFMQARTPQQGLRRSTSANNMSGFAHTSAASGTDAGSPQPAGEGDNFQPVPQPEPGGKLNTVRIYPYGVARNRLIQAAKRLGVPAVIVRDLETAQMLMTLRTYYRSHEQPILNAEERGVPIYVLRANTVSQMEQALLDIFNLAGEARPDNLEEISGATQTAIQAVLNGQRFVDLPPASPIVRRQQHEMARQADLVSHSYGKDPHRRVRIYRD